MEPTPKTFPQILKKIQSAGRPVEFTFLFGERPAGRADVVFAMPVDPFDGHVREEGGGAGISAPQTSAETIPTPRESRGRNDAYLSRNARRREEAFSEQEERRKMAWEEPRLPDVAALLAAARSARSQAADGLSRTISAVKARKALRACEMEVQVAEAGAVAAVAPARAAPRLAPDGRSARSEAAIKECVKVTTQCAKDARRDADEAARMLRAYSDLARAEARAPFGAEQIDSAASLIGVRFRDQQPLQPVPAGSAAAPKPLAGFKPGAAWCCGAWTLRSATGVQAYCKAIGQPAPSIEDCSLDVAVARSGSYEIRVAATGSPVKREVGKAGSPVVCTAGRSKVHKTLVLGAESVSIDCENGQQTSWAPGAGGSLVITSTYPKLTDKACSLTFVRTMGDLAMFSQDDERVGEGLEDDEDPFAKYYPARVEPDVFLRQLNSVVATAGLKHVGRADISPTGRGDARG